MTILRAIAVLLLIALTASADRRRLFSEASAGELVSATVQPCGWIINLEFAGMSTGGAYSFGWSSSNVFTTTNLLLTVTSQGYATNTPTTRTRYIAGTTNLVLPFPNQTTDAAVANGTNVVLAIALREEVHAGDSNIVLTLASGLYNDGNPSQAVTNFPVTSNSTLPYFSALGRWLDVPFQYYSGFTVPLRFDAQARHGIAAVVFELTDGVSTNTHTVLSEMPDGSQGDPIAVPEFFAHVHAWNLTNGTAPRLVARARAYPRIGTATEILDTHDGANTQPTPDHAPLDIVYDPRGTFGSPSAYVAATGNDSTGVVVSTNFGSATPPAAFLTIDGALSAICKSNVTWFSRSNVAASTVYLGTNAGWAFTGGSSSYGTNPLAFVTLARLPSLDRSTVAITTQSGDGDITDKVKLSGVTLSGSASLLNNIEHLWLDQCHVNLTGSFGLGNANTVTYWTRNLIQSVNNFGVGPAQSTGNSSPALVRGNTFTNFGGGVFVRHAVGNVTANTSASGPTWVTELTSQTAPAVDNMIWRFNRMTKLTTSGTTRHEFFKTAVARRGAYIGDSIVENTVNGSPVMWIAADASTGAATNIIVRNLVSLGQRFNWSYNDVTNVAPNRIGCVIQNSAIADINLKSDVFAEDSQNTNNWSSFYGVGYYGNLLPELVGVGSAGNFQLRFAGANSYAPGEGSTSATNFFRWQDDQSYLGSTTSGNGTYRMTTNSPGRTLRGSDYASAWDMEGHRRDSTTSVPGAHVWIDESNTRFVSLLGSDSNAGTFASPWRTFNKGATSLVSGLTLRVGAGDYQESVTVTADASSGSPIIVDGQRGARLRRLTASGSHWWLHNVLFGGHTTRFEACIELPASAQDGLVVSNCLFDARHALDVEGITWDLGGTDPFDSNTAKNSLVIDTEFTGFQGTWVLQVGGTNNVFQRIHSHDHWDVDYVRLHGRKNVIRESRFERNDDGPDTNHRDWVQGFASNGDYSEGHLIFRNWLYERPGSSDGAQISQIDNATNLVFGWVFYANQFHHPFKAEMVAPGSYWLNNLFFQVNETGSAAVIIGSDLASAAGGIATNTTLWGNIAYDCGAAGITKGFLIDPSVPATTNGIRSDWNFVGKGKDETNSAVEVGTPFNRLKFWATFETNSINGGDPGFVDEASYNFRPLTNSVLLSASTNLTSLLTSLGIPAVDYDGVARPETGDWTIGPFEIAGAGEPEEPNPPAQLRIIRATRATIRSIR